MSASPLAFFSLQGLEVRAFTMGHLLQVGQAFVMDISVCKVPEIAGDSPGESPMKRPEFRLILVQCFFDINSGTFAAGQFHFDQIHLQFRNISGRQALFCHIEKLTIECQWNDPPSSIRCSARMAS